MTHGIYLEDHTPTRPQFRVGRREPVKPVIVVHTAESGTDTDGPDPKAENVADFIRRRTTVGSYHLIGDADSIIHMIRFENEAYGDRTGSNRWAIHISLAMNAADWPRLPSDRRTALVESAAAMANVAADWLAREGYGRPKPVLLTKAQSEEAGASGFISHARRDPGRRSDPGKHFPWEQFLRAYNEGHDMADTIDVPDRHMTAIQQALTAAGYDPGVIDGIPGPKSLEAVKAVIAELETARSQPVADPDVAREAGLWRRYAAAQAELSTLTGIAEREG